MVQGFPIVNETVQTASRNEMIEITARIQRAVDRQRFKTGMVIAHVAHTTAGITINENADPDVKTDMLAKLDQLIPHNETYYQHDEGNSDAHLKASLMGHSVTLLVEQGRLQLGRWQGVYLCEFDGPRERRVLIKMINLDPRGETD
jgi:secondary thiamine-phosphate synthase enzyme